jgi:hypothetical protein
MTDLDRLLLDLPIAPAPVGELIATGGRRRRRRRGLVVVGALAGVLVTGGIAVGSRPVADDDRAVQPAGPVSPVTEVVNHNENAFAKAASGLEPTARPVWDGTTRTLRYLSSLSYGGCGADATTSYEHDALVVELVSDPGEPGRGCTMEASAVVAVVRGLAEQPRTVVVVDNGVRYAWPVLR